MLWEELMLMNPGFAQTGPQGSAPAWEDPERMRRGGGRLNALGSGTGGVAQGLSRILPFLMGTPYPNLAGFPGGANMTGMSQNILQAMAQPNAAPAGPNGRSAVTGGPSAAAGSQAGPPVFNPNTTPQGPPPRPTGAGFGPTPRSLQDLINMGGSTDPRLGGWPGGR